MSAVVVPSVALPFNHGVQGDQAHGLPADNARVWSIQTPSVADQTFVIHSDFEFIGAVLSDTIILVSSPPLECLSNQFPSA